MRPVATRKPRRDLCHARRERRVPVDSESRRVSPTGVSDSPAATPQSIAYEPRTALARQP